MKKSQRGGRINRNLNFPVVDKNYVWKFPAAAVNQQRNRWEAEHSNKKTSKNRN